MKVLFMFGGLPHYIIPVLNQLNRIPNLEIDVVIPGNQNSTLGAGVHQSLKGVEFTLHQLEEYRTFYGKAFFRKFDQLVAGSRPDVIITAWPYVLGFLYHPGIWWQLKRLGIRLVLREIPFNVPRYHEAREFFAQGKMALEDLRTNLRRDSWQFTLKYQMVTWLRKFYFNMVDAHVCYIEDAWDIIGSYGVPRERIFVTYNSPDTDAILAVKEKIRHEAPLLPPHPHRILHVGRLVKWKRVDMLMEVTARLRKHYPDVELVIVGTGPEEQALRQQAETLGMTNAVRFIGGVYDMEVLGKYFMESSVYVLAGMGGLSINEAMCFDKPIICSEADGTEKKLVREGYNGLYFENGNPEDLYEKLNQLFSRPELAARMGKYSGQIIREEVNIHTVIRGYIQAFNYVAPKGIHLEYQAPVPVR